MLKINEKDLLDAVKFLQHYKQKITLRNGLYYKLINSTQVEVFNIEETEFIVLDLPVKNYSTS